MGGEVVHSLGARGALIKHSIAHHSKDARDFGQPIHFQKNRRPKILIVLALTGSLIVNFLEIIFQNASGSPVQTTGGV
jgi:hypothetical protein